MSNDILSSLNETIQKRVLTPMREGLGKWSRVDFPGGGHADFLEWRGPSVMALACYLKNDQSYTGAATIDATVIKLNRETAREIYEIGKKLIDG